MVAQNKLLATPGKGSVIMIDPVQWNDFIKELGALGGHLKDFQQTLNQVTTDVQGLKDALNKFPCKNGTCAFLDAANQKQQRRASTREKITYLVLGAVVSGVVTLIVNLIIQIFK